MKQDKNRNIAFKLHPNSKHVARELWKITGANRFIWDYFLAKNKREWTAYKKLRDNPWVPRKYAESRKPPSSFKTFCEQFTPLRKEIPELEKLPCAEVRYVLKYLADALKGAIDGKKGWPKRKHDDRNSFTIPQNVRITEKSGNTWLYIPKTGSVLLRRRGGNPYARAKPKQAVIKRVLGNWHCIVCYEVDISEKKDNSRAVGVDMNAGQVMLSNSEKISTPEPGWKSLVKKLKKLQKKIARQSKGSNRRKETKKRIAKVSNQIANARHNWHHHTSKRITGIASTVVVEDLNIVRMTKSAKGNTEKPGKNVKGKAGLNRVILDTGWGRLQNMLEYKAFELVKINPKNTSRTCHKCGHTYKFNRKTQSRFECVQCGHKNNADINAAKNIRDLGVNKIKRDVIPI